MLLAVDPKAKDAVGPWLALAAGGSGFVPGVEAPNEKLVLAAAGVDAGLEAALLPKENAGAGALAGACVDAGLEAASLPKENEGAGASAGAGAAPVEAEEPALNEKVLVLPVAGASAGAGAEDPAPPN